MTLAPGTRVRIRSEFKADPGGGRTGTVVPGDPNVVKRLSQFSVLVRYDAPFVERSGYQRLQSYHAPRELEVL